MKPKKTKPADLERKRFGLLLIGVIISLSAVLFAFEWRTYDPTSSENLLRRDYYLDDDDVVIIKPEPPTPPPPPPPTGDYDVVDNNKEVTDEIKIDFEAGEATAIPEPVLYIEPEPVETYAAPDFFTVPEIMPSFVGGDEARIRFLRENVVYPDMARRAGIEGTVYVSFIVKADGSITDIVVLKSVGGGCDEEAIRVIKKMPRWNPGMQFNSAVPVKVNMPIRFKLN